MNSNGKDLSGDTLESLALRIEELEELLAKRDEQIAVLHLTKSSKESKE